MAALNQVGDWEYSSNIESLSPQTYGVGWAEAGYIESTSAPIGNLPQFWPRHCRGSDHILGPHLNEYSFVVYAF